MYNNEFKSCRFDAIYCQFRYALLVQLYLKIDRIDLAQAQVKAMRAIDEDHTLSTLANAWVLLSTVGPLQYDSIAVS